MYISGCRSVLVVLSITQVIKAHNAFEGIGNKLQLVAQDKTQTIGLKPLNCVLENANWCGIELDSYYTRDGCLNVSPVLYNPEQSSEAQTIC